MKIFKNTKAPEKFKHYANLSIFGLTCILAGAFAMNEYQYRVVNKVIAETMRGETIGTLGGSASQKYSGGDKSQKLVLETLSKAGSGVTYTFLINNMRRDSFDAAKGSLKRSTPESIAAADTHAADVLLLEAMDYLSNSDLQWLLNIHSRLFDQKIRFKTRKSLEENDYSSDNERNYHLTQIQTSLTELERSQLQSCAQKLQSARDKNKAGDGDEWHKEGLCSKETKYKPYDSQSWIDRTLFLRVWGYNNRD